MEVKRLRLDDEDVEPIVAAIVNDDKALDELLGEIEAALNQWSPRYAHRLEAIYRTRLRHMFSLRQGEVRIAALSRHLHAVSRLLNRALQRLLARSNEQKTANEGTQGAQSAKPHRGKGHHHETLKLSEGHSGKDALSKQLDALAGRCRTFELVLNDALMELQEGGLERILKRAHVADLLRRLAGSKSVMPRPNLKEGSGLAEANFSRVIGVMEAAGLVSRSFQHRDAYYELTPLGRFVAQERLPAPMPAPTLVSDVEIFQAHARNSLIALDGREQIAAQIGAQLVTIGNVLPDTSEFADQYRWYGEEAHRKLRQRGALAAGAFLWGGASAFQDVVADKVYKAIGPHRHLRDLLLERVDSPTYPLRRLADRLCEAANRSGYASINFHCSEYHEDQGIRCLVDPLIVAQKPTIYFPSGTWSASGRPPLPQDVRIACERTGRGGHNGSPSLSNRYLYDFKGYHVFVSPAWLEQVAGDREIPAEVRGYIDALLSDFDIGEADRRYPDYGLAIRAWLSLYGGVEIVGGDELTLAPPILKKAAMKLGRLPRKPDVLPPRDSDEVFEGLITGEYPAALIAAIHGDLLQNWWNRKMLPDGLWRLRLVAPSDFSEIMDGDRLVNFLSSGIDDRMSHAHQNEKDYLNCWVNFLRAIGGIFSELGNAVTGHSGDQTGRFDDRSRQFLAALLFVQLGPTYREPFPKAGRPRMKWAFVPDTVAATRLFGAYDHFVSSGSGSLRH